MSDQMFSTVSSQLPSASPESGSSAGRLLRLPLRLLPGTAQVRVLSGQLRGKRWIVGSGPHSYWMGIYEPETQQLLGTLLKSRGVFYDVGAQAGFFSLLASLLVGEQGLVVAVEPVPTNASRLRRHVDINQTANIEVVEAAVSDKVGRVSFDTSLGLVGGCISVDGDISVQAVTIDSLVTDTGRPPDVLKVDAEGAEPQVLKGARRTLLTYRPYILLSTHGVDVENDCLSILEDLGYKTLPTRPDRSEFLATPFEGNNFGDG